MRIYEEEKDICGVSFWTLWGMAKQIPGRKKGSNISVNTLLQYVREGCPCFEHAGALYFPKDTTQFLNWLMTRRPERQQKAMARAARYR